MFRPSLLRKCAATMTKLCPTLVMHAKGPDGKPMFADVEHCLMAKVADIKVMMLCASHRCTHPRDAWQDLMCKAEVTRIQMQMENDFRLDPEVSNAKRISSSSHQFLAPLAQWLRITMVMAILYLRRSVIPVAWTRESFVFTWKQAKAGCTHASKNTSSSSRKDVARANFMSSRSLTSHTP